jgi:hypothetical protein
VMTLMSNARVLKRCDLEYSAYFKQCRLMLAVFSR